MNISKIVSSAFLMFLAIPVFAAGEAPIPVPVPGTGPLIAAGLVVGLAVYLRNKRK